MKTSYVTDLLSEQNITSFFLVCEKELRNTREGRAYLRLELGDRSGTIEARMWDQFEGVAKDIHRDDFVKVQARVEVYRNKPQLALIQLRLAKPEEIDLADYLPHTTADVEKMFTELCGYAESEWPASADDERDSQRKGALRRRIDVALYTPGNARGRAVRLPVVPAGMSAAKEFDQLASAAAAALACMIGLNSDTRHGPQRAILLHAIRQLALLQPHQESGIEDLVELIDSADPRLVNAIGKLDNKHFKKIVEGLETLRLTRGELFDPSAERLDFDRLFGRCGDGRTQLTIISTKFLGDLLDVQFWMAQFLNELQRWASRNPSNALQAAVFFDEADIYLPARSQPASKAPMEDLLKRGRSAGIGLLLATQSSGDLDYKCRENIRSWFLGRIKEDTAIGKLKPMLEGARYDIAAKLPAQAPGEFQLVCEGNLTSLKADSSLIRAQQLPEEAILRLAASQTAPINSGA